MSGILAPALLVVSDDFLDGFTVVLLSVFEILSSLVVLHEEAVGILASFPQVFVPDGEVELAVIIVIIRKCLVDERESFGQHDLESRTTPPSARRSRA